ncbi:MAG: zinc-ribbon domain-containing protein [bacterium]
MELYEYQKTALDKLVNHLKHSFNALVVMATGLGKTLVIAHWARSVTTPGITRGLILCHEKEILDQNLLEFTEVMSEEVSTGVFNGDEKNFQNVDWLFATFQTMQDWHLVFLRNEFDYIIVDESHHSQAPTYRETIEYFNPVKLIGLTATPDRMDEKNIREIFGDEAVDITLPEAIAKNWLTPVEYRLKSDNLNSKNLNKLFKKKINDQTRRVSMKQLNETLFIKSRDTEIAKIIMAENLKALIFCENIDHCENFSKFIPGSFAYHSGRSDSENIEAMRQFKNNELQYLVSVNKCNEGVDVPDAELIVFLRATDSLTVFLQQLGRGLRRTEGKDKVVVMDFVANCERILAVKELAIKVMSFEKNNLSKDPMHIKGKSFDFVFTRQDLDIIEVLEKVINRQFISEVESIALEYLPMPKNILPADQVFANSSSKYWWQCSINECGHIWFARANSRLRGSGCPACANKVVTSKNNLAARYPELAKQYLDQPKNALPADLVIIGSQHKFWWKCTKESCGHEYLAFGYNRLQGKGCPACVGKAVTSKNNLAAVRPDLAKELMPAPRNEKTPESILATTDKKLWWQCKVEGCGHEWQVSAYERVTKGRGCPACLGLVATEKNNLAVTHAILARDYMAPPKNQLPVHLIVASHSKYVWWKCYVCSHEWKSMVNMRRDGLGCPSCAHRTVSTSNAMTKTHPGLALEYMAPPKNLLPAHKIIAGTNKKLWWKCTKDGCGFEWQAQGNDRVNGNGCPSCGKRRATHLNNLAITHPALAKEYMAPPKNSLSAEQIVAGTHKKLWWKCANIDCGHEWEAIGKNRVNGRGCPKCNRGGRKKI